MRSETYQTKLDTTNFPEDLGTPGGLTLSFLRNIDDCVKLIGTDGRLKFMNENGLCRMELPDLKEVRGLYWWDLWPTSAQQMLKSAVEKATAGEMVRFTADCPTASGWWKKWDVTVTPIPDSDGTVNNVLSISKEIP